MQRRDLDTFLGLMEDAWSVSDIRDMQWFVSRVLHAFVPCDSVWSCIFPAGSRRSRPTRFFADPEQSLPRGSVERSCIFGSDNLLIAKLLECPGNRVARLADIYSRRQRQANAVLHLLARACNVNHQLGLSLCIGQNRTKVFLLNRRSPPFTKPDVSILARIRDTLKVMYDKTSVWDLIEHIDCDSLSLLDDMGLSLRERHVLYWIANGKRNDEVARILAISVRTVEKHLEHIYAKLGVETRGAAVSRAHQLGVSIMGGEDINAYHKLMATPERIRAIQVRRRKR